MRLPIPPRPRASPPLSGRLCAVRCSPFRPVFAAVGNDRAKIYLAGTAKATPLWPGRAPRRVVCRSGRASARAENASRRAVAATIRAARVPAFLNGVAPLNPPRLKRGRRGRPHAPHQAAPRLRGNRLHHPRQGRVHEPRRVGQGPRRARASSRSRGAGRAPARRHGRRGDRRQHRHRPRGGRQRARLPHRHRHSRDAEQEKKDTLRLLGAELVEVPAVPYRDPNNYVKYSGRLAEALAETEPDGAVWANQFDNIANRAGPHRDHGAGDLGRDRRPGRRLRLRGRLGRHAGRRLARRSRPSAKHRDRAGRPAGAALYTYFTPANSRRRASSITEGIGQGRITKNLEGAAVDMAYRIPDEETLRIVFALLQRGGPVRGRLDRASTSPAPCGWPASWAGSYDRDDPVRQRHALPVAAFQPGVSGSQVPARPRLAGAPGAPTSVGIQRHVTRIEPQRSPRRLRGTPVLPMSLRARLASRRPIVRSRDRKRGKRARKRQEVDRRYRLARLASRCPRSRRLRRSWHLPTAGRDPKAEFLEAHIPGALFFDIDDLTDEKSRYRTCSPRPSNSPSA